MKNERITYDVLIVGGGMVGAAAALGLAREGWRVAVIEHAPPAAFESESKPDLRISALGYKSVKLLRDLGAWPDILAMRAAPYRGLETWEWPESKVSFNAHALKLTELGYMVENHILQQGLWTQFEHYPDLNLFCLAQLTAMTRTDDGWRVTLDNGQMIETPLIIGADGAESQVRRYAGIGVTGWQYRQDCLLISIKTADAGQDVTWQQFYPSGPRAFLPLFDHWASLVWYDSPARIRYLKTLSTTALADEVAQNFPSRLGPIEVFGAASFPLTRRHAQSYVKKGIALIGDAAHTINPLAGQGVNLGYRDVEVLIEILLQAKKRGEDYAQQAVLKRYQFRRYPDNLLMQSGMDVFHYAFSNGSPPLKFARNLALMAAQRSGRLKDWALKYAIGL
jgi:2-octaprenyl-3-methyl-6-methoxy-1,4-benzoquinol hydroxylase